MSRMTTPQTPERIELREGYYFEASGGFNDYFRLMQNGEQVRCGHFERGAAHGFAAAMRPVKVSPLPGDQQQEDHDTARRLIDVLEGVMGPGVEVIRNSVYTSFRSILALHRERTDDILRTVMGEAQLKETTSYIKEIASLRETIRQDLHALEKVEALLLGSEDQYPESFKAVASALSNHRRARDNEQPEAL